MMNPLQPEKVPVFNCIVYVASCPEGVRARVANLAGLECTAASERQALSQLAAAFKGRMAESLKRQEQIALLEPPPPPCADEQTRWIPVHL